MFFIGLVVGIFSGALVTSICTINGIKKAETERYNAEDRALFHFSKLMKIENVLRKSEENKENFFITIDKIKKVVSQ